MYCSGCGEALAGRAICPRCGRIHQVAGLGARAYPSMATPVAMPLAILERRINSLAVVWLVYAGFVALFGLMALAFAHAFMAGHMGPHMDSWYRDYGFGHHPWNRPAMPFFFWKFASVGLFLKVGLALAGGMGLLRKARWGRPVVIAAACFALFSFPFGTALGIWTLVVLLNSYNAAGYMALAHD